MPEICAIILAAGKSERMGTNKLLLPFQGRPMIRTVIEHVMESGADHVWMVLGAFRNDMVAAISELPVKHCYNDDHEQGMFTSVMCGFRHLPSTADAALVFLGDQPLIPGEVARLLISEYTRTGKGILIPVFRGKRGHPVLIDKKYAGVMNTLLPERGLRTLFDQYPEDIQEVDVTAPGILRDIDTRQDYENEIKSN
jgi:molybdenum cofactor cytidylyltransferase